MKVGDKNTFKSYCGIEITGEVIEITSDGYLVKGNISSNQHTDGLFRFTDNWVILERSTGVENEKD